MLGERSVLHVTIISPISGLSPIIHHYPIYFYSRIMSNYYYPINHIILKISQKNYPVLCIVFIGIHHIGLTSHDIHQPYPRCEENGGRTALRSWLRDLPHCTKGSMEYVPLVAKNYDGNHDGL